WNGGPADFEEAAIRIQELEIGRGDGILAVDDRPQSGTIHDAAYGDGRRGGPGRSDSPFFEVRSWLPIDQDCIARTKGRPRDCANFRERLSGTHFVHSGLRCRRTGAGQSYGMWRTSGITGYGEAGSSSTGSLRSKCYGDGAGGSSSNGCAARGATGKVCSIGAGDSDAADG